MDKKTDLKELQDIKLRLDGLIRKKVIGGYAITPWGFQVKKFEKLGQTHWVIDGIFNENILDLNKKAEN